MRLLLIKTSSLGDVIHNLPVVTDIKQHFPDAQIDWCVEESFADIPRLHPGVRHIHPVAIRRWRKNLFHRTTWQEISNLKNTLGQHPYDLILDTQGLLKSALLTRWTRGPVAGYDRYSAREPVAARFYDHHHVVDRNQHAVPRNRLLAAAALGYPLPAILDYGISAPDLPLSWLPKSPYVVLLSATSRDDKLWPEAHWTELGRRLHAQGYATILPSGNAIERARAARLASAIPGALAAPPLRIPELANLLAHSVGVVGVDTDLTHLAVALKRPTVALYTATDPGLTGVLGTGFHINLGGKAQCPDASTVSSALLPALSGT